MEHIELDFPLETIPTTAKGAAHLIEQISTHPDVVNIHKQWEEYDQNWKDVTKDPSSSDIDIMRAAALVREARKRKDAISDAASRIAHDVAEGCGVIQDYTGKTLGDAILAGSAPELSVEWHNLRRQGIGGSSMLSTLGFHWRTHNGSPVMMSDEEYLEMITDTAISKNTPVTVADNPTQGVLYRGHMWEPATLVWLAAHYDVNVAVSKDTWRGKHPRQVINTDGIIVDDKGSPIGIVECKTSSREWTWQWGVPTNYRAQVLWYLNATGLDFAYVIVRFDNGTFDVFTINADDTIDGTDATEKITSSNYLGDLDYVWGEVEYYRDRVARLWEDSPRLREEKNATLGYVPGIGKLDKDFLDDASDAVVIHGHITAPYERMDESFTTFSTVDVGGDSYAFSEAIYPLYPLEDKPEGDLKTIDAHQLEMRCGDGLVIATTMDTYKVLTRLIGKDGVVCASALRRMYDGNPGGDDFVSTKEVVEWVETLNKK